jgi:hypothetical protein
MQSKCIIKEIEDDDVLTIQIEDIILTGFFNTGTVFSVGEECMLNIKIYDDVEINESHIKEKTISRIGKSLSYSINGILDIDTSVIHSVLDFDIDKELLFDYAYLHGKYVKISVVRFDFLS